MGVFSDIQAALDSRLNLVPGLPVVAWENVHYKPTKGTPFVRPTNIAGDTTLATTAKLQNNTGIYQVDLFYPTSNGTGDLLDMLDTIYDHFKVSNELTANTTKVMIKSIGRTRIDRDGSWSIGSIEIVYNSYAV